MSQVQQNLHQTLVSKNEEEEEEALSLSDLPSKPNSPSSKLNLMIPNSTDDFEFRVSFSANETADVHTEMCAADDVFYNGTILPLRRPSVSSRADSMDLSVLSTSRSGSSSSSGSSSYCVSRSHSTKSASGAVQLPVPDPPRRSVSNNYFYAFPSPSPQLRGTSARKSNHVTSGRKSTSSVPGNILRLGVLPAPEIDIRARRSATEKRTNYIVEKKQQLGFGSYGAFGCKCVPDEVIEPTGTRTSQSKLEASRKERNGEDKGGRKVEKRSSPLKFSLRMGEKSLCRTRIFHWIEELSIGKTS